MSDGTHTQSIPRWIEPRKFAAHGVKLQGPVPAGELKRLGDACIGVGSVNAELEFSVVEREKLVTGQVSAELKVQCQRCLEPADLNLSCDVNLAVVWSQDTARQVPEHLDPWVVEEDEADLYSMLEEEILLGMPYVVYHDYPCVDAKLLGLTEDAPETDNHNPFQVLKHLKDKPKK